MKKPCIALGSVAGVTAVISVVYGVIKYHKLKNEVILENLEVEEFVDGICNCCCSCHEKK